MKKLMFTTLCLCLAAVALTSCKDSAKEEKEEEEKTEAKQPKYLLTEKTSSYSWGDSKESFEYDNKGNLVKYTYRWNDSSASIYKMTYDSRNHMTKKETFNDDNDPTQIVEIKYNDNGDTICYISKSSYVDWDVDEKYTYKYDGRKKTDMYEYHKYPSEGEEELDLVCHHIYTNGKETSNVYYELNSYDDSWEITVPDGIAQDFNEEFEQCIRTNSLVESGKREFKYTEGGKLLRSRNYNSEGDINNKKYEYDSKGNLTKMTEKYRWSDEPYVTTCTYNDKGKCTSRVLKYDSGNSFEKYTFDENNDTIKAIKGYTWNYQRTLSSKVRYTYYAPGKIKEKYEFSQEDEWGHEYQNVSKTVYNKDGFPEKTIINEPGDDYYSEYAIEEDYSGAAEDEFKHYYDRYHMNNSSKVTYKYVERSKIVSGK